MRDPEWHGFHDESHESILDGETFHMEASVNGRVIYADGSENFLSGYHGLMNEVCRMPREGESARD